MSGPSFVRAAGLWFMIATVVGAFGGIAVGLFPNTTDPLLVNGLQFVFFVVNAVILFGLLGFVRSGAAGESRLAQVGSVLAILGSVVHVPFELLIIWWPDLAIVLLPSVLVQALGLIVMGIAVLRAGRWQGWRRFIALICGLYPFLIIIPGFALSNGYNAWVLVGWMVAYFFLGLAVFQHGAAHQQRAAVAGV